MYIETINDRGNESTMYIQHDFDGIRYKATLEDHETETGTRYILTAFDSVDMPDWPTIYEFGSFPEALHGIAANMEAFADDAKARR